MQKMVYMSNDNASRGGRTWLTITNSNYWGHHYLMLHGKSFVSLCMDQALNLDLKSGTRLSNSQESLSVEIYMKFN